MKKHLYIGTFRPEDGKPFTMETFAFSYFEAFFLLTAKAIQHAATYQLETIKQHGSAHSVAVGDILNVKSILTLIPDTEK